MHKNMPFHSSKERRAGEDRIYPSEQKPFPQNSKNISEKSREKPLSHEQSVYVFEGIPLALQELFTQIKGAEFSEIIEKINKLLITLNRISPIIQKAREDKTGDYDQAKIQLREPLTQLYEEISMAQQRILELEQSLEPPQPDRVAFDDDITEKQKEKEQLEFYKNRLQELYDRLDFVFEISE